MLKCYFVVATLFKAWTFTAGETHAPVPLKQFNDIAYKLTKNFKKEDYVKVYRTFPGYNEKLIVDLYNNYSYNSYPEKSILTLQTTKDAGGVYVLIWKIPGKEDIMMPFMLNKTRSPISYSPGGSDTFLLEGDKLIEMLVIGDKTLKPIWEFSDDKVIETLESGDAKASRVWKVQKTSAGGTPAPTPLKQFDNIAYEVTNHYNKEDFVKVYKAFGYNDKEIENLYAGDPEKSILTLQTPKDAGGVYVLIWKIPGNKDIFMKAFFLNKTVTWPQGSNTYLVEGNKLINIWVNGGKTMKNIWEFSKNQIIGTLESGDAKASRVWKVQKTEDSKQ